MNEQIKINWYRTPVDRAVMSRLMQKDDFKALRQVVLQLGLYILTTTLSYLAFLNVHATNWFWSVPLVLFCLFWHGTFSHFLGGIAVHELIHKTPFRRPGLNDFFTYLYSFLSWYDPITFRVSHVKHHQVTTHHNYDGEVILPQKLDWASAKEDEVVLPKQLDRATLIYLFWQFSPVPHPVGCWNRFKQWTKYSIGNLKGMGIFGGGEWWLNKVLPESNLELRQRHRNWARFLLFGHIALAVLFIATGNWFLIIPVTLGGTCTGWLSSLTGLPQHIGMGPDTPDFRLCCRTYTCHWFPAFLYWNMQYHVEHHMFPAVPFYNLPALRKEIEYDLPYAPHGLLATWREILSILKKQRDDPAYYYIPELPRHTYRRSPMPDSLPDSADDLIGPVAENGRS